MIGVNLVHLLENLHSIGKLYNDLKLDNILIGDKQSSQQSLSTISLIDFGLCSSYLDENGNHVENKPQNFFVGNLALASANAMNFRQVSRRDDLISLCYMLVYLIQGRLKFIDKANGSFQTQIEQISRAKDRLTASKLCKSSLARPLTNFVRQIFKIKFKEKPNYESLRNTLHHVLDVNNLKFDE